MVYSFERGWPPFPPARSLHWLFITAYCAAAAALITLVLDLFIKKVENPARFLLSICLVGLVIWAHAFRGGKLHADPVLWLIIIATVAGFWITLAIIERELPGRLGRLVMSGVLGCLAITLMLTKSALLAQIAGGAACAMLGLALTGRHMSGAAIFAAAPVAAFLALQGRLFSRTESPELLLLAWGTLGVVLAAALPLKSNSRLSPLFKAGFAVLIPALTVIYVLFRVKPWEDPFI